MKEKSLRFRMSQRRYNKLKLYAANKEKTMTQLIEDWVDRLPSSAIDDSDARGLANAPLSIIPLPNQPDG
ncbi:hypothetical protein LC612_17495 [Nostoc sp. CHAB 5834]|nr:hypothetical protein [Nostoc sp. CHAB 5834]